MPETNDNQQTPPPAQGQATPLGGEQGAGQSPAGAGSPGAGPGDKPPAGGDLLDSGADAGAQKAPAGDLLSDDGNATQEGVPDQYTFDPPDGFDEGLIDEERLGAFMGKAKEFGLSQAQFQGIMSYYAERTQASVDEAVGQWNERVDGWKAAAQTDKEIGGENLKANLKTAMQVVTKFGDKDLTALIKSPSEDNPEGLAISNHPAFLRFLNRIGKALGDPALVQGDDVAEADANEARLKRLYPSMFKESA